MLGKMEKDRKIDQIFVNDIPANFSEIKIVHFKQIDGSTIFCLMSEIESYLRHFFLGKVDDNF
jgi:hypothetical protein